MRKNRIIYLCIFILSLLFIYFYGGKVPYRLFYITLSLPLASLFYTLVIFLRFKYIQDIDKKYVTKGDKVKFLFSVDNEDFLLYPYMNVTFFGANTIFTNQFQAVSFSLLPRKKRNYSFELECKYRGHYEMGIKSVEIEDLLGLFKLTYSIAETKTVTVLPKIVYLDRFGLKTNFLSETNSILDNKYEDPATVSDIREYAYGDSIKKIHWKLTAKTHDLLVKNFQNTSETSSVLILDLLKNNLSVDDNTVIEDKVVECAVAVLYYCLSNWVPVNLVYFKDTLIDLSAKSPLDFEELYNTIAKLGFTEQVELKDILDIYLTNVISRTNIILFTSNVNYALYNEICKTKFSGYAVMLVYVSPEDLTGQPDPEIDSILSNLPEIGVKVYKVNISDEIKTILER